MGNVIDYAFLSQDSYIDKKSGEYLPENWERIDEVHEKSGYDAIVYKNTTTNEIVVAHRGTEFKGQPIKDLIKADGSIAFGDIPKQVVEASQYVQKIEKKYGVTVTNTGHSLGGFIADLVSKRLGRKAITFDQPSLPTDKYNLIWEKLYGKPLCPTSDVTMIMSRPDVVNNVGNPKGSITKLDEFIPILGNNNNFISSSDLGGLMYAGILRLSLGNLSNLSPAIRDIKDKIQNSRISLDYHDLEKTIIPGLLKYVQKCGDPTTLEFIDINRYLTYLEKRKKKIFDQAKAEANQLAQNKLDGEKIAKGLAIYKDQEQEKQFKFQQGNTDQFKLIIPSPKIRTPINPTQSKASFGAGAVAPPPLSSGHLPSKPIKFVEIISAGK